MRKLVEKNTLHDLNLSYNVQSLKQVEAATVTDAHIELISRLQFIQSKKKQSLSSFGVKVAGGEGEAAAAALTPLVGTPEQEE